jgi:hypothetical protein
LSSFSHFLAEIWRKSLAVAIALPEFLTKAGKMEKFVATII